MDRFTGRVGDDDADFTTSAAGPKAAVLGLSVALYGVATVRTAIVAKWIGWTAVVGGVAYAASGVAVGYAGFESGFGDPTSILA